jgi:hypothetical protein
MFMQFDPTWYRATITHLMYASKGGISLTEANRMTELELSLYGDTLEEMYKRMNEKAKNPNSVDTGTDDDS